MVHSGSRTKWVCSGLLFLSSVASAQQATESPSRLVESGHVVLDGVSVSYRIRRLPVTSFPELPVPITELLNQRNCLIPQTYEAHRPENVVHASLERPGSSDWAVLCSAQGKVSLLVFFGSSQGAPAELARYGELARLKVHDDTGVLGFNWGIDPASPDRVREAQTGMKPRPPFLDHDALADSVIDHRTIYHFYAKKVWTLLEMPQ